MLQLIQSNNAKVIQQATELWFFSFQLEYVVVIGVAFLETFLFLSLSYGPNRSLAAVGWAMTQSRVPVREAGRQAGRQAHSLNNDERDKEFTVTTAASHSRV